MKELLLDYITNELLEGKDLFATMQVRKNAYYKISDTIIAGRDFVLGVKVFFIYDFAQPRNITHETLEDYIEELLKK